MYLLSIYIFTLKYLFEKRMARKLRHALGLHTDITNSIKRGNSVTTFFLY